MLLTPRLSSISRVESNSTVTHLLLSSFPKGEEKIDPHGIVLSETENDCILQIQGIM